MTETSRQIFARYFSVAALDELVETHLLPSTARGVDGTNYDRFMENKLQEIELISARALSGTYKFTPYRQKLILKDADSPPRQVSIPTIRDKIALRSLNNFLNEVFFDARPQHSHPVVSRAITSVQGATSADSFLKLDVRSFYDSINHRILMGNVRSRIRTTEPLQMIETAISTPTGARKADNSTNTIGVPQGLSISNILASIYMRSIDGKFSSMLGLNYHRYVDDVFCVAQTSEIEGIANSLFKDLKRLKKLDAHKLGSGKSKISTIGEGIEFLGYSFIENQITVRKSTEKKLLSSLMTIINTANPSELSRTSWRVNLRITGCRLNGTNIGWMFYFSQINDKSMVARIDAQVKRAVTRKFGAGAYASFRRLLKTLHEVKYNFENSPYIINFDTYTRAQMEELLERVYPGRFPNLSTKTEPEVTRLFNRIISREVREMERDTLGGFS